MKEIARLIFLIFAIPFGAVCIMRIGESMGASQIESGCAIVVLALFLIGQKN